MWRALHRYVSRPFPMQCPTQCNTNSSEWTHHARNTVNSHLIHVCVPEQSIWTFIVDFSSAHRIASAAFASGKVRVMYFSTCSGFLLESSVDISSGRASNSNAVSIGPHRLPTTLNSSITNGAALNCSPAAQVLLRTYLVPVVSCSSRSDIFR